MNQQQQARWMNQQQQDRWAAELVADTLGIAWHDSDPQARRVADAAARYVADMNRDHSAQLERLRETARLAEAFARAKGRYHSQQAMCDLMEHFGLPAVRPGEES